MKKMIIAIAVLILFIITSIIVENKLEKSSNNILNEVKKLNNYVEKENWNEVDKQVLYIDKKWEDLIDKWELIVEHDEIDTITIAFLKAKKYVANREKEEGLAELKEFEYLIDHIPKMNKLELKNIF